MNNFYILCINNIPEAKKDPFRFINECTKMYLGISGDKNAEKAEKIEYTNDDNVENEDCENLPEALNVQASYIKKIDVNAEEADDADDIDVDVDSIDAEEADVVYNDVYNDVYDDVYDEEANVKVFKKI